MLISKVEDLFEEVPHDPPSWKVELVVSGRWDQVQSVQGHGGPLAAIHLNQKLQVNKKNHT